jgi:hypothetical protein
MKTAAVLACILLTAWTVNANGEFDDRGPGSFDKFPGPFNWGFGFGLVRGQCACRTGFWNPCRGVVGSQVKGCPNTNSFLQCNDTVCSKQNCSSGQVWNKTLNACAQCADGMHVASNQQVCVCNQGNTFNRTSRTCVACPKDSVQEADRCYCNVTKVFDYKTYACRDCPTGSSLTAYRQCKCDNTTQLWSESDWACKDCPGTLFPKPLKRPFIITWSKCRCTGTNQILDRKTVTCYTCPSGTTATFDNSNCQCQNRYQFFNMDSKKCECVRGWVADSAGTGCVRETLTTQSTSASTSAPPSP